MLSKSLSHQREFVEKQSEEKAVDFLGKEPPKHQLAKGEMSPRDAYQLVHSESFFDANPRLNMASFVTTWMEPEAEKIIQENLPKNFIDKPIYPRTIEIQDRCVTMLANLLNAHPTADKPVGTSTIGSSEAIHLAGLAMKWKWKKYAKGKSLGNPQIIMGSNVQVCWEKFARYFEVESVEVPIDSENRMDISQIADKLNERVIGVVGILGNTYSGEFDDIVQLNNIVDAYNSANEWKIPIHVDAASGGFVAPFVEELNEMPWDFRLDWVKSINLSGHKFGLVYPGLGWAIWRNFDDIDPDLIFKIKYLGDVQDDFGMNFSRGAANVFAQYYNFVRWGREGYSQIMNTLMAIYSNLKDQITKIKVDDKEIFELVSHDKGLPLVCVKLKEFQGTDGSNLKAIAHKIKERGWVLPVYPLASPYTDVYVMRMVIKNGFNYDMADKLVADLHWAANEILTVKEKENEQPNCAIHC